MIDDLVSLRILLLLADPTDHDRLRRGAGAAAVPVELVEAGGVADACNAIGGGEVDVVLIAGIGAAERSATIQAARSTVRRPFVFLLAGDDRSVPRVDGIDGVLPMPADVETARVLVEWCNALQEPRRALVVDDSKTMRSIVRKILAASRFALDVTEAEEASDAFSRLTSAGFELVFLDYNMPGMNGLDALTEIKRRHPQVHVILISAAADAAIVVQAREAGAAGFLKKPFYPADIDAIVYRILSGSLRGQAQ